MLRLASFALLLAAVVSSAQVPVPALKARVTDLTGTLTAPQSAALEQKLADFEQRKGAQVAVLMVPSTRPEEIEQFAIRVAEAWKLGRKGVDDGALLVVAKEDRALRIEVGYGLEGALTDATSRRIGDEIIVPYFRNGDFYAGIDAGVTRMLGVIDGEPLPEPQWSPGSGGGFGALAPVLPILLVFTVTFGVILKRLFGQLPGALATGGLAGGFAWLLIGVASVAMITAVAAFALTLVSREGPGRWASGRGGSGWGGGTSRGGGSGGGGFGGGGGGFGGGGSSSRW